MPEKEQLVLWKKSTAERVLSKKNSIAQNSVNKSKQRASQNQPNYYIRTELVKIVEEIKDENDEESANGYYRVKIARWDDSLELQKDHEWLESEGFEVIAYEMGGTTGLTKDSGAFVARGMVSSTGKTNWTFRAGGSSARPFVEITEVTDPENYIGNLIKVDDDSIIEEDIAIVVKGAISNEFQVGYQAFADKSGDNYYIDGYLLG